MALTFDASSEQVDFGSDSSLDNHAAFTFWAWVKPVVSTGLSAYMNKWTEGTETGKTFYRVEYTDSDVTALGVLVSRASVPSEAQSVDVLTIDAWNFVAGTFDTSAEIQLWVGDLTTPVAEVTYDFQSAGSGAVDADASYNLLVGPDQWGGGVGCLSDIACCGYHSANIGQSGLQRIQYDPLVGAVGVGSVALLSWLGENGTTSCLDRSGNGNTGTITGATVAANVPLAMPWVHSFEDDAYVVAAATTILPQMLQQHGG